MTVRTVFPAASRMEICAPGMSAPVWSVMWPWMMTEAAGLAVAGAVDCVGAAGSAGAWACETNTAADAKATAIKN